MKQIRQLTAIIGRADDGYVALCPELDIASHDLDFHYHLIPVHNRLAA